VISKTDFLKENSFGNFIVEIFLRIFLEKFFQFFFVEREGNILAEFFLM